MVAHLDTDAKTAAAPGGAPAPELVASSVRVLERQFDEADGGFGGAPKFPPAMRLELLLRHWLRTGDPAARAMAEKTLAKMAAGGMYDQVGGGFHRYSVDARWLVPHFEKMLYDNAMLAKVYVQAFRAFGNPDDARIARETLDYLLREMTPEEGGFFAAQDADSGGEEGTFYVWNPASLAATVGAEAAPVVAARFGVTARGNFEGGETVLSVVRSLPELAADFGKPEAEIAEILAGARRKMYDARARRVAPATDDKLLTDWTALAISAFALAARVLEEPRYEQAARKAANRILDRCMRDGRLLHREKAGRADIPGFATDYAYLIEALLDLYEATFEPRYFTEAVRLQAILDATFADPRGGYFLSAAEHDGLILRPKESWDAATPSSNSVAAMNLLRLAVFTGDARYPRTLRRHLRSARRPARPRRHGLSAPSLRARFPDRPAARDRPRRHAGPQGLRGPAPRGLREPAPEPRRRAGRLRGRDSRARRPRRGARGRHGGRGLRVHRLCVPGARLGPGGAALGPRPAMTTGLVHDERFLAHRAPYDHPEHPGRLAAIWRRLREEGLAERCERVPAREATDEELARIHTAAHIAAIDATARVDFAQLDPDTYACRDSALAARLAAGGLIDLSAAVAAGRLSNGLALLRPPGHHAEAERAMGFCLFNNVAVAARALQAGGVKRILIVDWDLHHGNGTQNSFWEDPDVLYFSTHQFPFYPGTGAVDETGGGAGGGATVNVPWPGGMGDAEYLAAFDRVLLPIARDFRPGLVLVSAGFDAADGDPLGAMRVSPAGYAQMTALLSTLAGGRLVLALEGGYDLEAISKSAAACLRVLLGGEAPAREEGAASPEASAILDEVLRLRESAKR